jgi:type I restriction enzyme S subunit
VNNYDNYKSTGHHWIGDIPSCWDCNRVGRTTYVKGRIGWKNLRAEDFTDNGPYLVTGTDFDSGKINWSKSHHVDDERYDEDPFIQLEKQDVLITKDGTIGKIAYLDDIPDRATLNSGIFVTRPLSNDLYTQRYFFWIVSSPLFDEFVRYNSSGSTILHLYQNVFERFFFPIPSIEEQKLISRYLDKKTSQIDSLVEKIQKKIELLKEQRTSLINHYVTKGLDLNVEMKDSGVEWIGEIPKHWTIVRLRFLCDIKTGGKDTQDNVENGSYPFFVRSPNIERINSFSFDGEAVLTSGDGAGVGKIFHYYVGKFDYHQRVYKFSNFKDIMGKYFYWFLKENFQYEILRWNAKSTVDSVRLPFLQNFPMVLPPIEEQENLLLKIDSIDDRVEKLIQRLMNKIEILKEYRQSLISSVVTGKVRITEDMI